MTCPSNDVLKQVVLAWDRIHRYDHRCSTLLECKIKTRGGRGGNRSYPQHSFMVAALAEPIITEEALPRRLY